MPLSSTGYITGEHHDFDTATFVDLERRLRGFRDRVLAVGRPCGHDADGFLPMGYILPILAVMLVVLLVLTGALAGKANIERTQDEGFQSDSNRAYKFGFTVVWIVYLVAWLVIAQGWMSWQTIFPVMGAVIGGSYAIFLGVTGLRGWHETRHASD